MTLVKYNKIKIRENNESLVDLAKFGFVLEPKYFEEGLSSESKMFLREGVAQKLLKIQQSLGGLRLKIWDGFRSRDVQNNIYQNYWEEVKKVHPDWDEEKLKNEVGVFVSPPYQEDRIPPHTTGGAVDLTLVDSDGNDLDMGTEFDYFGPEASSFFYEVYLDQPKIAENRKILREAMLAEDFTLDADEWWHFDYGSQIWALKRGKPFAIYGDMKTP